MATAALASKKKPARGWLGACAAGCSWWRLGANRL